MYRRYGGATVRRGPSTGVMSSGDAVLPHNYAAFAEAVARITDMAEWSA